MYLVNSTEVPSHARTIFRDTAYVQAYEQKKREDLAGSYRMSKDTKAFRIWPMQPDAWKGNKGIEDEDKEDEE